MTNDQAMLRACSWAGVKCTKNTPIHVLSAYRFKLPRHGPSRYNSCFYTTFISIYVFEITPIIIKIIKKKKYFIAHYCTSYANYEKIA